MNLDIMKKIYTQEQKEEIMDFLKTSTIEKTCLKFGVSKYSINKWKGWVRKNVKESNSNWYLKHGENYYSIEKNREKLRQNVRNFRKSNPEKGKSYGAKSRARSRFKKLAEYSNRNFFRKKIKGFYKLTAFDLWKQAKKQKLICPISGIRLNKENISVDHITPISKNGTNEPNNIRLVHKWVNLMLGIHSDEDFFAMCKTITSFQENLTI